MHKPTIKDVAKVAGVSIATVSRIINNGVGYTDATKQHVLATIEKMGYSPNAIARGLINKQSNTIGVLFPDVSGLLSAQILQGIEEIAQAESKSIIVCNTASDNQRAMGYLNLLREKQVDGVIWVSQLLTNDHANFLNKMGVPVITVSSFSECGNIPTIKVDDEQAAYDAVSYLIEQGHQQIGMLSGPPDDYIAGAPRISGYKQALLDNGIPFDETKVAWGDGFYFNQGCKAFELLYTRHPNLTAIFAASDELAASTISSAYEKGLKVPEQLSVIGYDDSRLAAMLTPPLTAVSQGFEEMGRLATKYLLKSIKTGTRCTDTIMKHSIIQRKSVRKR